jgi:hypothetical protein
MLIKSDFKDYYDCMQRYNVGTMDKKYYFVRKTSEKIVNYRSNRNFSGLLYNIYRNGITVILRAGYIGFCNEFYPYITYDSKYFYDYDSLYKAYSEMAGNRFKDISNEFERLKEWFDPTKIPKKNCIGSYFWFNNKLTDDEFLDNLRELFNEYAYFNVEFDKHYNKEKTETIIIYPNLKKMEFFKVKPPNICFQDLERYCTTKLLPKEKDIWPISDKLKAETHGFNKFSFRKDKEIK